MSYLHFPEALDVCFINKWNSKFHITEWDSEHYQLCIIREKFYNLIFFFGAQKSP